MAGEVSSTRNLLGHFDVLEKLEAIQKTLEAGPAPCALNYAKAVAKPKPLAAAAKSIPGPEIRSEMEHTLIISSCYENHRGVAVDRRRKANNQKVVVSCSSAEDAKKIEERLKMCGADLKVSEPEKRLPTVIIREVLRVNTDEDVVKSLKTQIKHITEVLKVTPELCKKLIKPTTYTWGCSGARSGTSPFSCSTRAARDSASFFTASSTARTCPINAPTAGETTLLQSASPRARWRIATHRCPGLLKPHRTQMAGGSSAEDNTDLQFHLQRNKLATSELFVEGEKRKIAVALVHEPYIGNSGEL
ncbi:hypothetical protein EVAR_41148_1 [Eumeta japonica]|uniref:Uncharacterized protein n=1 Tax=Eumeta variegata TaxID=151549 RepID=A0A4C1YDK4_EUMVA|nr:hypothetical protein EVAR_41148_1 [Eumeta japonica]